MVNAKRDVDVKFKESESILLSERYRKGFVEKVHLVPNSFRLSRKMYWKGPSPHRRCSPTWKADNQQMKV